MSDNGNEHGNGNGAATVRALDQLKPEYRRFVHEYLADRNGARAYVDAGFKIRHPDPRRASANAARNATRLLQRLDVAQALAELEAEREKETRVRAHRILDELAPLCFSNVNHYVVDDEGEIALRHGAPPDAMAAVASVKRRTTTRRNRDGEETTETTVELKLWDKNAALEKAMKFRGLLADRHEHSGPGGGPIPIAATVTTYRIPDNGRHGDG